MIIAIAGALAVAAASTLLVQAATINAASCSRTDVGNAVASAVVGDTVRIPAGTCSWTSTLTISKGITLLGAGEGLTVLQDSVSKGGTTCGAGGPIIEWAVNAPQTFRMSGMTIQGVTGDPGVCQRGHITLDGTSKAFRIDHITMNPVQTAGIIADGDLWGVIDHVTARGDFKNKIRLHHSRWGGASWGDGSWAEQLYWGTEKAIYVEDCNFTNTNTGFAQTGALDGFDGARIVFRNNTLRNEGFVIHGTDSDQRHRSVRSLEVYNNSFTYDAGWAPPDLGWVRGGTAVVYNNTITSPSLNVMVHVHSCRDADAGCGGGGPSYPPWGACTGSGAYDQNSAGGYRCIDQPGSGTSRLLSGDPPGTGWAQNILDPVYVWGNTWNGASNNTMAGSTNVRSGRDYFPGTARPGYTAYTYPHPLAGGTAVPRPPTNLRITR